MTTTTQTESHEVVQQYESDAQMFVTQGSQPLTRATPEVHGSWLHEPPHWPQSLAQLWQSSPASQTPLLQTGPHAPQSCEQLWHVSPTSQTPLLQTAAHGPQSAEQV